MTNVLKPSARPLAGDDLLPDARAQITHEIDIEAPPAEVWPWLVQMGRRRGGWYSWDLLDNGGVASADRIIPELQHLAVGDVLPIKATGPDGFAVLVLDPPRAMVLGDPSLLPDRPGPGPGAPRATWAFSLEPWGDAGTHVVVRVRAAYKQSLLAALLRPVVGIAHEIMQRKQLRTLKQRAEQERRRKLAPRTTTTPVDGADRSMRQKRRMGLRTLVGAGDRIGLLVAPFAAAGIAANLIWPAAFRMGFGWVGGAAGVVCLVFGVPLWLTSVVQIVVFVPRGKLITGGPFALALHPLYTSVALLVIPGCGLLLDSWLGFALGGVLYLSTRLFAPGEERELAARFPQEYGAYRERVLLPWL